MVLTAYKKLGDVMLPSFNWKESPGTPSFHAARV
jgi:hypothetical protein